jgi:Spy/CpxP family protein refolding chaperone
MKRILMLGAAAAAVMALCGLQAMAQEGAPRREGPAGKAGKPGDGEALVSRLTESLKLTADEAGKVKQILQTFRQSNENWMKEHSEELKDAQEQMNAARKDGNKEGLKAARDAMEKVQATRKDLVENLKKQLTDVPLTAEQVEKIVAVLVPPMGPRPAMRMMGLLRQVELTPEQQEKARKIVEQAQADAEKAEGPEAKEAAMKAAFEKIKAEVLTDDQRKALEKLEKMAPAVSEGGLVDGLPEVFSGLKLSDEQWTKARAIWEAASKNPPAGENRREARREVIKKIADEVLTPEQKEQLNKLMEGGAPVKRPRAGAAGQN